MYDDYKIMKQKEFDKLKKEYDNLLNVDSLNYEIKIYNKNKNDIAKTIVENDQNFQKNDVKK